MFDKANFRHTDCHYHYEMKIFSTMFKQLLGENKNLWRGYYFVSRTILMYAHSDKVAQYYLWKHFVSTYPHLFTFKVVGIGRQTEETS